MTPSNNKPINNFLSGDLILGSSFAVSKDISRRSVAEVRQEHANDTDSELVSSFLLGKGDAFAALVDRHASMVYSFAYRYLQNADNTSDVAQEVFIKVWKNIKKFDPEKNFKTWLLTITKNTALDFIKKKKPVLFSKIEEGDTDLDTFLAPFVDGPDLPDQILEKKYLKTNMENVLQKLSPSYRNVLLMRYTEHLKFREIADILQEPIDTIKSKHRRALILLRKLLKQ
jgi:RNA polymerase sigma-70 factor (ECF subfamily)